MPLDRTDAVVIGAGVEGLAAALTLALAGKGVVCVDRRDRVDELGGWDDAWVVPGTARALGLFQHGLILAAPPPHLSLAGENWRVLWPDAGRSARALGGEDGDALKELATSLRRWREALRETGSAARAMLASLDLVRQNDAAALGQFLRASATGIASRRLRDGQLQGLMLAMAARAAPVAPGAAGSAPMLLALADYFDGADQGLKPVSGGARALAAALAAAFKAAGGDLALGREVSEILMEREAAAGVALGPGASIKAASAVAAVSPRRLTQGLLSTRRYGRILGGLAASPKKMQAAMRIGLAREPDLPEAQLGLWRGGVSVWLGASVENTGAAARAMHQRQLHETPVVELRLAPGLREGLLVSPLCPAELAEGPWTPARLDRLRSNLLAAVRMHWPQTHALIEEADLLKPALPGPTASTGAIFGGAERTPALDAMFAFGGDTAGALIKGVHLCVPRALEPDCQAGVLAAGAVAGLNGQRLRA